jgi:hypothetical protein
VALKLGVSLSLDPVPARAAQGKPEEGMIVFTAMVLVCQLSVPPQACDESKAIDVISTRVDNEFACMRGFQETMARGALREGLGENLYMKTRCVRRETTSTASNE